MFVTFILSKIRASWRYHEAFRELSRLSNRELQDIGISRYEIAAIARQHAAS
jgi:uncharacterized protein YjiS (DUF1127 family)